MSYGRSGSWRRREQKKAQQQTEGQIQTLSKLALSTLQLRASDRLEEIKRLQQIVDPIEEHLRRDQQRIPKLLDKINDLSVRVAKEMRGDHLSYQIPYLYATKFSPFWMTPSHVVVEPDCVQKAQAALKAATSAPTWLSRLNGAHERRAALLVEFPAIAGMFAEVYSCARLESVRPRLDEALADAELLKKAIARRGAADAAEKRKRLIAERKAYERARIAAVNETTRAASEKYRAIVPFTGRCVYCERLINKGLDAHLDHIIPVSRGGLAVEENLVWACDSCNNKKSDRSFHHFCKDVGLDPDKIVARLHKLGKYI